MAQERQRAAGDFINARFPKGDRAQQEFRMMLNTYLQHGMPEAEAVARATVSVRDRRPGFTPVGHAPLQRQKAELAAVARTGRERRERSDNLRAKSGHRLQHPAQARIAQRLKRLHLVLAHVKHAGKR